MGNLNFNYRQRYPGYGEPDQTTPLDYLKEMFSVANNPAYKAAYDGAP